jgi:hypothetical protein
LEKKIEKSIFYDYVSFESIELGFFAHSDAAKKGTYIRLASVKLRKCLTSRIDRHTNAKKDEK